MTTCDVFIFLHTYVLVLKDTQLDYEQNYIF